MPAAEWLAMGRAAHREYTADMGRRYRKAGRAERSRLLNEFVEMTGMHRKYAISLLNKPGRGRKARGAKPSRFTPAVLKALLAFWRAADYPRSVRLVVIIREWMPHARKRLSLDEPTCELLQGMSARTMDRLLHPHRVLL